MSPLLFFADVSIARVCCGQLPFPEYVAESFAADSIARVRYILPCQSMLRAPLLLTPFPEYVAVN